MTISSAIARVVLNANGVSTVFPVPIQAYLGSDFLVLRTTAAGATSILVYNSDYTMAASGTLNPTAWSLTTAAVYPAGDTLQAILNLPLTQQTQYVLGQAFPSNLVQMNVDRLTQDVIRLQDQVSRSVHASDYDLSPSMTLPSAAARASQYLAFDMFGNVVATPALPPAVPGYSIVNSIAPVSNTPGGSVGLGTILVQTLRTGGLPQYGNVLFEYLSQATIPAGQFDTGFGNWATAQSLTGGEIFGGWDGANTPSNVETFTVGAAVGREINYGNRWSDFGLQTDVGGTRYTVGLQLVPDVVPSVDTFIQSLTMTIGTPGVVNWPAHNCIANTPVTFSGAGTPPAAIALGTIYFVLPTGLTANSFQVSASINGPAINFATSSTGALFGIASFPGSFAQVDGASVHLHRTWVDKLMRYSTVMPAGHANLAYGEAVNTNLYATFTGTLVGTALTLSALTGAIAIGAVLVGAGVPNGTTIVSGSGTAWVVSGAGANVGPVFMTTSYAPLDYLQMQGFWINGIDMSAVSFTGAPFKMPAFQVTWQSAGYGVPFGGTALSSMNGGAVGTLAQLWAHVAAMTATFKGEGLLNV